MYIFFNDTATTQIYTLSLHDALPISARPEQEQLLLTGEVELCLGNLGFFSSARGGMRRFDRAREIRIDWRCLRLARTSGRDRKSTRLNSSHVRISYAVFCLKKKTKRT